VVTARWLVAGSKVVAVGLCSCSFVLGLEEVPYAPLDGGAGESDGGGRLDATGEERLAPRDGASVPVDGRPPPPPDAGDDACVRRAPTNTAGLSSCEARVDGKYCGDSTQLNPKTGAYPNKNDLVVCDDQRIARTHPCGRCISMPPTHSDECDPCDCLPDGYYCGRDLPEWNTAENGNAQVRCTNGTAAVPVKLCATCVSGSQAPCE
jgi:hypothetical protein